MPRFFVNEEDISSERIVIKGTDVNHIKNVLRLRENDQIILCDGKGNDYIVSISNFDKNEICTKVIETRKNISEPPIEVELFQGLPKLDKMEYVIQKCVEMGISRIYPIITQRTDVKIEKSKDLDKKIERWRRISLEASKQSNRGIVPEIMKPISFGEAVNLASEADLGVVLYENEKNMKFSQISKDKSVKKIAIIVGSEGGFTEAEIETASLYKIMSITLGPRILRTETAAIVALSILMYEFGDIGI